MRRTVDAPLVGGLLLACRYSACPTPSASSSRRLHSIDVLDTLATIIKSRRDRLYLIVLFVVLL